MSKFASYEKTVEATVVKTTHTVRMKLNFTACSVKDALSNVPNCAILSMVIDDSIDNDGIGELVFSEEKQMQ